MTPTVAAPLRRRAAPCCPATAPRRAARRCPTMSRSRPRLPHQVKRESPQLLGEAGAHLRWRIVRAVLHQARLCWEILSDLRCVLGLSLDFFVLDPAATTSVLVQFPNKSRAKTEPIGSLGKLGLGCGSCHAMAATIAGNSQH